MYLQHQCLQGHAKDSVKNLTDFKSAMARLDERYGRSRVIVDNVIRDINQRKLPDEETSRIILLYNMLEEAWDDVSAINATEEFCNVVTLGVIEAKMPSRLQLLWAENKDKSKDSKELMDFLKAFLKKQKEIAEEALTMKSCVLDFQGKKQNKDYGYVNNIDFTNQSDMGINRIKTK